jgi:hypothetical protein
MLKHISKVKSDLYQIALDQGLFSVRVAEKRDRERIDQLIADITDDFCVETIQKCFKIVKVLQKYDPSVAVSWWVRECGGLGVIMELVQWLIKNEYYGDAGRLLLNLEEIRPLMCRSTALLGIQKVATDKDGATGNDE